MRLGICAILRDEASYLEEWVGFHRDQGAVAFRIYDNGSTDGTPQVLRSLGIEPVIWAGRPHDFDSQQRAAYFEGAEMLKGRVDWVAFIDADEFAFGRTAPLATVLDTFPDATSAIAVPQLMFGSGGHLRRLPGPVTRRFIRCAPRTHPENRWFKTIARPERVLGFESVHRVRLSRGDYASPDGTTLQQDPATPDAAAGRIEGVIGLHHYALKSLEEFRAKQARWADRAAAQRMDDGYFFGRDGHASAELCRDLADFAPTAPASAAPPPALAPVPAPVPAPAPAPARTAAARPPGLAWDVNHVIAYGQSYATGWGGWPPLSTAPRPDCLMLGGSVRPLSETAPDWQPVGEPVLRPLVATAQDAASGRLLPPGAPADPAGVTLGETVLESALGNWRARLPADGVRLLASACGVGGRSIEQLSRGAQPDLFNRLRACIRRARDAAAAAGLSYGVAALLLLQGEANVAGQGASDRDGYRRRLDRLIDDMLAEAASGAATPGRAPAVLLYQTSGAYADATLGVPQAQLEVALQRPGVALAAPCYPYPEAGGHPDPNGYRWLGAQFGKVLDRMVTQGAGWHPLHPLRAAWQGEALRVTFHVPVPPLAWGRPFLGSQRWEVPDRGFSLTDGAGAVPLRAVELDGPDAVRLLPARPVRPGEALLRYAAGGTQGGHGALHDSDPTLAEDAFVGEVPGIAYDPADLAALAGRRYPLVNWCAAFALPLPRPERAAVPAFLVPLFGV